MHHTGNSISMAKLTVQNHIANRYSTQADLKKKKKTCGDSVLSETDECISVNILLHFIVVCAAGQTMQY